MYCYHNTRCIVAAIREVLLPQYAMYCYRNTSLILPPYTLYTVGIHPVQRRRTSCSPPAYIPRIAACGTVQGRQTPCIAAAIFNPCIAKGVNLWCIMRGVYVAEQGAKDSSFRPSLCMVVQSRAKLPPEHFVLKVLWVPVRRIMPQTSQGNWLPGFQ